MKRTPFPVKQASRKTWEEVFKTPGSISVETFVTAESILRKDGVFNLNHPNAPALQDTPPKIKALVLAHWIRHKKFGDYLIDTGMDTSYQKRPYGRFKGILVRLFMEKTLQQKGQDILARIKEKQITLKGVFFTHLHFDHVSGAIDLPNDTPIQYVAGKDETYFMVNKRFLFQSPDYLAGVETLYEIDFSDKNAADMPLLGKCVDVFGDGSLWAVSTSGHTPAHMAFLVNGNSNNGPVLLTGDSCLLKAGLEHGIGPGKYSKNIEEAQKSLEKLVQFTQKYPDLQQFVTVHHL